MPPILPPPVLAETVDEVHAAPNTPILGDTQPVTVVPATPESARAAPPVTAPPVAVSTKLQWMESVITSEEDRALRAEVDALMAIADGHVESGNWLGAYDAAQAVLERDRTHADAQSIVARLKVKLHRELRARRLQALFSQMLMGLVVGGFIVLIPLAIAWLGDQLETRWEGWGVTIAAYALRGFIGLWLGGMIALGLSQAVVRRLTRRPSPSVQTLREVATTAGALAAITLWVVLPTPLHWPAFGVSYALLVLVHFVAPGGNPFGGDQGELGVHEKPKLPAP